MADTDTIVNTLSDVYRYREFTAGSLYNFLLCELKDGITLQPPFNAEVLYRRVLAWDRAEGFFNYDPCVPEWLQPWLDSCPDPENRDAVLEWLRLGVPAPKR